MEDLATSFSTDNSYSILFFYRLLGRVLGKVCYNLSIRKKVLNVFFTF